jgi:translation initiation factor 2A
MTVSCEWTADSRHLLTATLFPRLRVENGYKLWAADGRLVAQRAVLELEEATLSRAPHAAFQKPPPVQPAAQAKGGGGAGGGGAAAPAPAGKYVPPSRRGQPGASASFDIHAYDPAADRDGRSLAALANRGAARGGLPVGADPADAGRGRGRGGGRGAGRGGAAPAPPAAAAESASGAAAMSEAAKKHKATGKKLRQIAELLEAQAAGKPLEKNQLDKIGQAQELEDELRALQLVIDEEGKTGSWR